MSRADTWTIAMACEEFEKQGMPVDPYRFTMAVRAFELQRAGEGPSGASGGRGHAFYEIGQLQHLHSWMMHARQWRQVV